jgi:hypothetical protein
VRDVHAPFGYRNFDLDRETLVAGLLNLSRLLCRGDGRGDFTSSGEGGRRFGARRMGSMGGVVAGRSGNGVVGIKSCDDGSADRKDACFCTGEEGEEVLLSIGTSSGSYVP